MTVERRGFIPAGPGGSACRPLFPGFHIGPPVGCLWRAVRRSPPSGSPRSPSGAGSGQRPGPYTGDLHPLRRGHAHARRAIHASGNRPIRSRSAKSAASRWSLFTHRDENAFTPSGYATSTCALSSASVSAAGVPAVGGLQHHLWRLPRAGQHLAQVLRVVREPDRLQQVAGLAHPHQHRPSPMQIHPDEPPTLVQFAHRGLLESLV